MNAEQQRLRESALRRGHWKRWGPYLSERAWGTVREDYSADGTAWEHFPHDHARSRAYRWNEDGLAGICDRHQYLCLALAVWNEHDPMLKERAFGLSGHEGNHGEDVKEYYFHLDNTPTHSYMKYLYKLQRLTGFNRRLEWFIDYLIVEALRRFHRYFGDEFRVECPTGSGRMLTLQEVACEVSNRLGRIFLRGVDGRRAVYGSVEKFQRDPHWRDLVCFSECFNGDTGAGVGASHQTGRTGLVGFLMRETGHMCAIATGRVFGETRQPEAAVTKNAISSQGAPGKE